MAALREHARPGRRAYLIEQAWLAGEHNVAALAAAAGVARGTVYADLESRGISPRTDRQEPPALEPITVNGYTGAETDEEVLGRITDDLRTKFRHLPETDENRRAAAIEHEKHIASYAAAKYHNRLLPAAVDVCNAARVMQRRIATAETAWNDLSTATAWHATHHRWVAAAAAAQESIQDWRATIEHFARQQASIREEYGPDQLDRWYAEHVPEDQRIDVFAHPRSARYAQNAYSSEVCKRREIAAQTLQAGTG